MADPDPKIEAALRISLDRAEAIPTIIAYLGGPDIANPLETYARELLGLDPPIGVDAGYRSDSVHPLYPGRGTIHPDNGEALASVAEGGVRRARELRQLVTRQEVDVALSSDMLLFGSPASEGLSRVVFGYSLTSTGLYVPFEEPLFDLAYRWELDEESSEGEYVRRYVHGNPEAPPRPPWRIRNINGNAELPFYKPDIYGPGPLQGFLKEDFLLVTRVPNFLTPAYTDGRFLVSFGGAHGVGTRAVQLLLRSKSALQDVARLLPPREGRLPSSYQILLRAARIVHSASDGSSATTIHCVDAVRLEPKESHVWGNAHSLVSPRLDTWLNPLT
jgi:hypothetical protein